MGGGARDDLGRERGQGPHRPLAPEDRRERVARADHPRGERDEPGLEPRREVDRLRGEARGRRERPGLPAAAGRGRGPPPDEGPDRGLGPEVVRGQPEARLHQPGLAGPRQLGRAGEAAEGAQGLEDDGAHLRQARGPLLGPLARRSPGPRLLDRHRGRGAEGGHARHGARAVAGGGGHLLLRHRARWHRGRLRRRLGRDRHRLELRRVRGPRRGGQGPQPHPRQPGRRRLSGLQPGRALHRLRPAGGEGLLRRPDPARAPRPGREDEPRAHGGVGPLGRHARLDAGLEGARRRDRRRRSRARLPHRRRHGRARAPHEGPHLLGPRPLPRRPDAPGAARGLLRAAHAGAGGPRERGARRSSPPSTTSCWPGWRGAATRA